MKRLYFLILILFPLISFAQNLATFTQVGPVKFPDNPSVQTTGMGRVSQLIYHPKDSNVLFAVTASGGVFKSSNEGASWRPLSDFLPQTACGSLAINPLNPKVMYLGTGDANYNGGGLGVWKTKNGGITWTQSSNGIGNKLVSYILFTPGDTNTLIAACGDGIYKTTDGGFSWIKKTSVNASYRDLTYRPQSNKILYSATNSFFYRSYDNGNTWLQSAINSSITCAGIKIAVCPKDTSKLFCVVWKSGATSPFGGIYKSTNNGTSFSMQVDTPNILGYSSDGKSMDGQGAYNLAIVSDPTNANTLYIAGINIWKSTNEGVSFTLKSHWAYGVHADKHGFLFSPYNPKKLFIYHDGGLDRSTDGGNTWTTLEDGLSASEFYKMGTSGLYTGHIIGGLQDNGMDVAVDKKFATVRGGDWGGDFAFDAFDNKMLYENGGLKRNIVTNATGAINGQSGLYAVHPNDSNALFEATTNLFRTKNIRENPSTNVAWTQLTNISGNAKPIGMAYSKASKGTFYVAFTPQSFYRSDNINASTPNFSKISSFPFKSGEEIKQLETCDYDSNIIYVTTSQSRLLKSKDKGTTWSILNRNLPSITIIKFLLDQKAGDSSMYACTALGVYYRNKLMTNWINFSQGLPTIAQITDMEIVSDGTSKSRLHISTYGRGIWQTDLYKSTMVAPVADFTIQPTSSQSCANTVILVDNSIFSPSSRKWQITPNKGWSYINGTDSLSSRAEIQFNTSEIYFISLLVTNSRGSDIKTTTYNYSNLATAASCTTTTNILGGYGIGIYQFELNAINNVSGAGSLSYEDFSCKASTLLKGATTYTAWVTSGTTNNENAKVYIDYNNNGSFTDANELVGTITSGKGRRSCTFITPLNPPVVNKFIRLRIVSDFSNVTAPCGALSYGQSEDYAVYFDKSKPAVSITIPKPLVSNSFIATFKTSEVISGFDAKDITVNNATISNFTQLDVLTYSAKITPINNGKVKVSVIENGFSDLSGNFNNAVSDSTVLFLGIKSFTFSGLSVKDTINQTPSGGNITCNVPYGTNLDSLAASFTLSDSSKAFIGTTKQLSAITKNTFNNTLTYSIKSKDSSVTTSYIVNVIINKNTECKLLTYSFINPSVNGIIDQTSTGGTITINLPYGTDVTNLVASFTLSDAASVTINSIKQISNTSSNNFDTQVIYRITAQDTAYSKSYQVNITFGKNKACDLLTFSTKSPSISGTVTQLVNGGTVQLVMPFGSSLKNLTALFTLSDGASAVVGMVKQVSGTTINDFSSSLIYKIVAEDTAYSKTYTVGIAIEPNNKAELISYDVVNPSAVGIINNSSFGGYVNITVPFGTDLTNLVGQFTISDSAKATVNGLLQRSAFTSNNFSDTVIFTVRAQNNSTTKKYLITVKPNLVTTSIINSEKLNIYPNPANKELWINYSSVTLDTDFEICNVLGQIMMEGKLIDTETSLDISNLTKGIYYLKLKMEEGYVFGKFVKE